MGARRPRGDGGGGEANYREANWCHYGYFIDEFRGSNWNLAHVKLGEARGTGESVGETSGQDLTNIPWRRTCQLDGMKIGNPMSGYVVRCYVAWIYKQWLFIPVSLPLRTSSFLLWIINQRKHMSRYLSLNNLGKELRCGDSLLVLEMLPHKLQPNRGSDELLWHVCE